MSFTFCQYAVDTSYPLRRDTFVIGRAELCIGIALPVLPAVAGCFLCHPI